MTFWIIAVALAGLSAALLLLALVRGRPEAEPAAAYDLRVYRDQLKEVDRDEARGVIAPEDATRARTEISRRILAADAQLRDTTDGNGRTPGGVALSVVLLAGLCAGSVLLYRQIGAPGYGDLPRTLRIAAADAALEDRPLQADAEASLPPSPPLDGRVEQSYLDLMQKLRDTVAARPDDLEGHRLLARNEASLGNFAAAHAAQAEVIRILGDRATASDYADLADMMVISAGGYVSPEAADALSQALRRDPRNGPARYYVGLMFGQIGRPDRAFAIWRQLIAEGPDNAPWIAPVRAQIMDMAALAGETRYQLPPPVDATAPGPDAADVAAAQDMTPEERQQMIRGMVDQLSERLGTEGGTPQEWARLIRALGVLGDTERAEAIWGEAQQVFAGREEALGQVRAAATQAGLVP